VELADMICSGVFEEFEQAETASMKNSLASEIRLSLSGFRRDKHGERLKSAAEKLVKHMLSEVTGKKPVVVVHIID
jgi:mRNA degradation ribonuclease J1/J2